LAVEEPAVEKRRALFVFVVVRRRRAAIPLYHVKLA
jgi:hypothetical protein